MHKGSCRVAGVPNSLTLAKNYREGAKGCHYRIYFWYRHQDSNFIPVLAENSRGEKNKQGIITHYTVSQYCSILMPAIKLTQTLPISVHPTLHGVAINIPHFPLSVRLAN